MNVVAALEKIGDKAELVILDCLTLWVSNLMLGGNKDDKAIIAEADKLAAALKDA